MEFHKIGECFLCENPVVNLRGTWDKEQFEYICDKQYIRNRHYYMHIAKQPKMKWVKVCRSCFVLKHICVKNAHRLLKNREITGRDFRKVYSYTYFDFYIANKDLKNILASKEET